jgi:hypothetical protein|tara:strand:+ start:566 stop:1018 length:453 start_codon:yes stop_codon:yes gene_type:complete
MNNYSNFQTNRKERCTQECVSAIKKSQRKSNIMLANASGIYEKIKAVRPQMLKIIKFYDIIKHEPKWTEFLRVAYIKSCTWDKEVDILCLSVELKVKEKNYIRLFKNNLKKIKKMCQDTSVSYYSLLPDNMPIDVRTHCVQFISQATIRQ